MTRLSAHSSSPSQRVRGGALVLAALVAHASVIAAQSAGRAARVANSDRISFDSSVTAGTLPNGLRYYVQAHAVPAHRAELRLAVDAGSVLEEPTQLGVAHFVEHMAFDGSRHFAKLEIQHQLEAMGMQFGADLNAATTFDETTYRLTIPTDRPEAIATGVRILGDWAHGITFDSAAVEAERGIIMGEWRLRTNAGSSEFRLQARYINELLPGSAYGDRLPIGDPRIIQSVSRAELVRFYKRWYRPQRMAVVVVGDVDVASVVRLIKRELGVIPAGPRTPETNRAFPARMPVAPAAPVYAVFAEPSAAAASFSLVHRLPVLEEGKRRAFRESFVQSVVASIVGERLQSLKLGGAVVDQPVRSVRNLILGSSASGDLRDAFARLLAVPAQVVQHGFTEEEVERVRTTLLTQYQQLYDSRGAISSAELAESYQSAYLSGDVVPARDALLALARESLSGPTAITVAEANAAARAILGQAGRIVYAPLPANGQLIDAELASIIADSVRRAPALAYRHDVVGSASLIAVLPPAGRVDSVRTIPEIGVTVWRLSNGARVVLKPTTLNGGQLLGLAVAPGGYSVASDSEYIDARLAVNVLSVGGLGNLSAQELTRTMNIASASMTLYPYIGELNQGITGTTSPRDAKMFLELIHLELTAPRVDTAAISSFLSGYRGALAQPGSLFEQRLTALRFSNDPRARPLTAAMVDSLDPRRALAFYRARFADASAFTFYFVGAFSLDSIRPLVEQYLASLPSTHAGERWRDIGVRQQQGPDTIDLPGGAPGHTPTSILISRPTTYDASTELRVDAVAQIAQRRLNARLRTQLGATYAVGFTALASRHPAPRTDVTVQFDAEPDRADSLSQTALDVLDSLARFGPTASEVADVVTYERQRLTLALKDNQYWIRMLSQNEWDGFGFANGLVSPDPRIAGLTVDALRATAARMLDTRTALRVFNRPAGGGPQ